jgi:hypothetical protein
VGGGGRSVECYCMVRGAGRGVKLKSDRGLRALLTFNRLGEIYEEDRAIYAGGPLVS